MSMNISALSMGNHTYRNSEINEFIDGSKIARPMNIMNQKGQGYIDINYNGKVVTLINLIGTLHMGIDCELANPFKVVDEFLKNHKSDYTILDMHAETTSEKIAMGFMLDGRVDAVVGTHTHVQTNDARILPNKTLYISDLGMTGPKDGVLGVKKEIIIDRFLNDGQLPFKLDDGVKCQLNGVIMDLGLVRKIQTIHLEK